LAVAVAVAELVLHGQPLAAAALAAIEKILPLLLNPLIALLSGQAGRGVLNTEPWRQSKAETLQLLELPQPAAAAAPVMRQQEARAAAVVAVPDFLLHQELQLDTREISLSFLLLKETMAGMDLML